MVLIVLFLEISASLFSGKGSGKGYSKGSCNLRNWLFIFSKFNSCLIYLLSFVSSKCDCCKVGFKVLKTAICINGSGLADLIRSLI